MAPSNQTHSPLAACRGAGSHHALALSMISISASGTTYILFTSLFPLRLFCQ
ncbi:hypothetical protein [Klebsiella quasipneumoniae]|uniref:hypothetical protein n=1 Tax=Klebsiella quasipneumoniae TaxID=1463165 RepID=UPI0005C83E26|nr:hypothetical protein [Klebsiella quasipneumoniae]MCJ1824141.1 hypothetical protein [Klebsiella quasipneumoniae subsp. quasipneumoniae]MDJ1030865.1 hypothetical protein [Klebsiella quasipneumoniae]UBH79751.1 hypothetical protein LA349_23010 [Klebsiella quasipneumoniae]UDC99596.1 hypothetical protein LGM20_15395 [Klebsiella quasipneumoniae subsp. quasipneumoniae]HBQ3017208.1 hypothetical protein [Klebsiella quasipneumoniae subsp. quasipneumoniae]